MQSIPEEDKKRWPVFENNNSISIVFQQQNLQAVQN